MDILKDFDYTHLKVLLDNINYAVLVENYERKIVFVNKQFFILFGIPLDIHDQLIGSYCFASAEQAKSLFIDAESFIKDIIEIPEKNSDRTDKLHTVDGRILQRKFRPLNYELENSTGSYSMWTYEDITDVEAYQSNLEMIINKEKELNSLRSQFLRITSHELRTPLTIITTSAELSNYFLESCKNKKLSLSTDDIEGNIQEIANYNNVIIEQVDEMSDILNTLLVVENIDNKKTKVDIRTVDVEEYTHVILRSRFIPHRDGRSVSINLLTKERECAIDVKLFKYCIINLVDNAFKYSAGCPPPQVNLSVSKNTLNIEVVDFGIGILEEDRTRIYDSFYRGGNINGINGTGVGLMVAKYAAEVNGGSIELVESNKGKTVFKVKIGGYGISNRG